MSVSTVADYAVERPLGASGRYLLARTPERLGLADSEIVLKVNDVGGTSGANGGAARALRELQLFAGVQSEHLVALYDAGQEDAVLFYAMRWHPAGSLDGLDSTGEAGVRRAVLAVAAAARGAHDLHEAGIAHSDIQPARVLLCEDAGSGGPVAVLADLELARHIAPGLTMTGEMPVGNLAFVDPAVVRGARTGRASDVWSLAATLHVALSGVGVYPALPRDMLAAVRHVLSSPVIVDPGLPPGIAAVLTTALSTDPAERPATAAALADALEAAL